MSQVVDICRAKPRRGRRRGRRGDREVHTSTASGPGYAVAVGLSTCPTLAVWWSCPTGRYETDGTLSPAPLLAVDFRDRREREDPSATQV